MSGRSTSSCFSTSISRKPLGAYLASSALMREDLPVPRAPVSSTLLAGWPSTNCRVFCSTSAFWESMPCRSRSAMRCTCLTGSIRPLPFFLRQRNAIDASQSGSGASAGSSRSSRETSPSACSISLVASLMLILRTILRVDRHIIVRQVASPYRRRRRAAVEDDPHRDFGLFHDPRPVGLPVVGAASAVFHDQHILEIEVHLLHREVRDAGITHCRQYPPEVGVGGEKRGLDQRG